MAWKIKFYHLNKKGYYDPFTPKNKNGAKLKNWRPLSLLNVDYKIITKCLSHRIINSLPYILHSDQTGFIKGRFTGINIRRI